MFLTPQADWDHLAEARQKLAAIDGLIADAEAVADPADPPPGLSSAYLETAADLAKQVALALQSAAGEQIRIQESGARRRGLEGCSQCRRWLPKAVVTLQPVGYAPGGDDRRVNHRYLCDQCRQFEEGNSATGASVLAVDENRGA